MTLSVWALGPVVSNLAVVVAWLVCLDRFGRLHVELIYLVVVFIVSLVYHIARVLQPRLRSDDYDLVSELDALVAGGIFIMLGLACLQLPRVWVRNVAFAALHTGSCVAAYLAPGLANYMTWALALGIAVAAILLRHQTLYWRALGPGLGLGAAAVGTYVLTSQPRFDEWYDPLHTLWHFLAMGATALVLVGAEPSMEGRTRLFRHKPVQYY